MLSRLVSRVQWLPLLLLFAAAVRIGALIAFPSVFAFDQNGVVHGSDVYDFYARYLIQSGVYGRTLGVADALIPPGYSYALAALYSLVGRGYWQVGLFNTALDLLSIAFLYGIGLRLFPRGKWVGLLAGLITACYPYLVFQNLTLIDTPLIMMLMHAFVFFAVLVHERPKWDRVGVLYAALAGLALGCGILTRPALGPLAAFVGLWFLFRLNLWQSLLRILPVAVVSIAVIAPWLVYASQLYNGFVLVSTNGGQNFWIGNCQWTIPFFRAGYHTQWVPVDDLPIDRTEPLKANNEWYALAFQYLGEHRDQIPELLWVKFAAHWSIDVFPYKNPVSGAKPILNYDGSVRFETEGGGVGLSGLPENDPVNAYSEPLFDQIGRTVHRFYFGSALLLAVIGVVLSRREWRHVSLIWFTQIVTTAFYVIYVPTTRYRSPSDPFLFLFTAYTVVMMWTWFRNRRTVSTVS